MTRQRTRTIKTVGQQSAEIALAVPQVVAHRVTRMALAGPVPSERDRREFQRMVAEKQSAFTQAWAAMAAETVRANQAMATSILTGLLNPFAWPGMTPGHLGGQLHGAALGVLAKGLEPVHRKATANARRLSRTKLK